LADAGLQVSEVFVSARDSVCRRATKPKWSAHTEVHRGICAKAMTAAVTRLEGTVHEVARSQSLLGAHMPRR
jgi:hypothetical protein